MECPSSDNNHTALPCSQLWCLATGLRDCFLRMSLGSDSILRNERVNSGPTDCSAPGNSRLPSAPGPLHHFLRRTRFPSRLGGHILLGALPNSHRTGPVPTAPCGAAPWPSTPTPFSGLGLTPSKGRGRREAGRKSLTARQFSESPRKANGSSRACVSASYSPSHYPGPAQEQPWRLGLCAKA